LYLRYTTLIELSFHLVSFNMRSSFISTAILAFASAVYATNPTPGFDPITSPIQDQNIAAGSSFDIVWDPSANYTGTVTIQLLQGATPSTLSTGDVIKAGIDSSAGTYTWAVPTTLQYFATYGFVITADSNSTLFQYSFPFHVTGLSGAAVGSSTSTYTMHLSTGTAYTSSSTPAANSTTTALNSTSTISKPTSNITLSTTIATKTASTGQTTSSSSSAAPTSSKNAAVAQVATGSLAMIGGLIVAFAL